MINLERFIKEARKRGFSDLQIRQSLLNNNQEVKQIQSAFEDSTPKTKLKNQICLFLNPELIAALEKRAKKNLFTLSEQIEDIIRRSCLNTKKSIKEEKLDDTLVSLFSRRR